MHGLCSNWRQWKTAKLNCNTQQRKPKSDMYAWHCGGYIYLPARTNLSDLPSSHICSSRHLLELQLGNTWQREAICPCRPVRLEGSDGEKVAHYVCVAGSCRVWTMRLSLCCRPASCPDSEWNMEEEERACLDLPTQMSHCGEWALGTGRWIVQTGKINQWWWHFTHCFWTKTGLLHCCIRPKSLTLGLKSQANEKGNLSCIGRKKKSNCIDVYI